MVATDDEGDDSNSSVYQPSGGGRVNAIDTERLKK